MVYKEETPLSEGRQITFPDSNHLFIEAMDPGNDIFEETGEIRAIPRCLEARAKKSDKWYTNPSYIHIYPGFHAPAP